MAAYVWDAIAAQSAGMVGGLRTRPGNAILPTEGLPQPNLVAPDPPALARKLIDSFQPAPTRAPDT
jgi:2-haloacid dehalogenase